MAPRQAPASARHDEARPTVISRAQSRPDIRQLFDDVEAVKSQQLADRLFGDIEGDDEVQVDDEQEEAEAVIFVYFFSL